MHVRTAITAGTADHGRSRRARLVTADRFSLVHEAVQTGLPNLQPEVALASKVCAK